MNAYRQQLARTASVSRHAERVELSECLVQECTRISLVAFGAAGEQHPGIPVTGDRLRNAVGCSVGLPYCGAMMFFGARPVSSAARCNAGRCSNEVKTINTPRPIVDDVLCVRLKGRDLVIST